MFTQTCAENLFVILLQIYGEGAHFSLTATLCPMLLTQVTAAKGAINDALELTLDAQIISCALSQFWPIDSDDDDVMEKTLMREAYYRAIGLGAYDFYDQVDFVSWYTNQLEKELRAQLPSAFQYA